MTTDTTRPKGAKIVVMLLMAIALLLVAWSAWTIRRAGDGPIEANGPLPRSTFVVGEGPMRSVIDLEVASTSEQIRRGLMARDRVTGDGMVFRFRGEPESFWMKGTRIPLDIVFVSPEGRVLNVATGKPFDETPIPSDGGVGMVIEVPAGRARLLGLEKGALVQEDRKAPMGE